MDVIGCDYQYTFLGLIFAQFPSPVVPQMPSQTSASGGTEMTDSPSHSQLSVPLALPPTTVPPTSAYSELGDGQVMEVLSQHLDMFRARQREGTGEIGDRDSGITLYREAIEHCARLYRIMVRVDLQNAYT